MTIGDRIKKQRELLGISQVELAEKMKVSKQTLYKQLDNLKMLMELSKEHRQTIFDNITYWHEKEGH